MVTGPVHRRKLSSPQSSQGSAKMLPCCSWLSSSSYKRDALPAAGGALRWGVILVSLTPTEASSGRVPQLQESFTAAKGETRTSLSTRRSLFLFFSTNPLSFLPPTFLLFFLPTFPPRPAVLTFPFLSFTCVVVFLFLTEIALASQTRPHLGSWYMQDKRGIFPWTGFIFWHFDIWTASPLGSPLPSPGWCGSHYPPARCLPVLIPWWAVFFPTFVHPENWEEYIPCHPAGYCIKFSGLTPYLLKENINSLWLDWKLLQIIVYWLQKWGLQWTKILIGDYKAWWKIFWLCC